MQKYRILKTVPGVRQGELHPFVFEKDSEHPIDDDLAAQFYEMGVIDKCDEEAVGEEEKSKGDAPSNKAKKAAPENKAKA